jgi:hypothetical protein
MRCTIIASIFCLVLACAASPAQDRVNGEKIVTELTKSTVFIITPLAPVEYQQGLPRLSKYAVGTGVFIGYSKNDKPVILTNYHVVRGGFDVRVFFGGNLEEGGLVPGMKQTSGVIFQAYLRGKPINLLARSATKDMALLEVNGVGKDPAGTAPLPLAASEARPGATVHSIGCSPVAGLFGYSNGSVRSVGQREFLVLPDASETPRGLVAKAQVIKLQAIETSTPINSGDSGGPLVNDSVELVGIAQSKAVNATLVSVFVDLSEIQEFVNRHNISLAKRTPRRAADQAKKVPKPPPVKEKMVVEKDPPAKEKMVAEKEPPAKEKVVADKNPQAKAAETKPNRSFRNAVDEGSPLNRVASPKAGPAAQPQSRIVFKTGFIIKDAAGNWTYQEYHQGKLHTGTLTVKQQNGEETVLFEEQRKFYFRMTLLGLERSSDQKEWEKVDPNAEWNQ